MMVHDIAYFEDLNSQGDRVHSWSCNTCRRRSKGFGSEVEAVESLEAAHSHKDREARITKER